jgi:tRNA(Ile2) C34 agmatinyltransferase TiaS
MAKVRKIPALRCPQCQGTRCSKGLGGSGYCEDCNRKTLPSGESETYRKMSYSDEPRAHRAPKQRPNAFAGDTEAVDAFFRRSRK